MTKQQKKTQNPNQAFSLKSLVQSSISSSDLQKYSRGSVDHKAKKKPKTLALKTTLIQTNESIREAATAAVASEVLLPSEAGFIELENKNVKVYKLKQKEIVENIDMNTARNAFDLQLHAFAPYTAKYSRNGRFVLTLSSLLISYFFFPLFHCCCY
jgi:U3 small nucleolar RNA-associated protein 7